MFNVDLLSMTSLWLDRLQTIYNLCLTYLLAFFQRVKHTNETRMTQARQCDDVTAQQVRNDLPPLRFVKLVGDSLLEEEHGRFLLSSALR